MLVLGFFVCLFLLFCNGAPKYYQEKFAPRRDKHIFKHATIIYSH